MELLGLVERLRSEWQARTQVDVPGMVAGLRGRLDGRLTLSPLALDADLAEHRGPLGLGVVRTWAFSSANLRKLALVQISMPPLVEGFAVTLLPRLDVQAPIFAADLMVLPTRLAANAEIYGPPDLTRDLLTPLRPTFQRLGPRPAAPWSTHLASGAGLHASAGARAVDELFGAITGALGHYLEALEAAPRGGDNGPEQGRFFAAFHAHGPRAGAVGRIFGAAWADRFSRLVFE